MVEIFRPFWRHHTCQVVLLIKEMSWVSFATWRDVEHLMPTAAWYGMIVAKYQVFKPYNERHRG